MGLLTIWDSKTGELDVDEGDIFTLANKLNLSEYEFFYTAGSRWGITLERVQQDFKEYLWLSSIPFYVTDWVRMQRIAPSPSC
ncbi:MAG: hypothetical protein KAR83_08545 [Thermodesulfovibrionales bacterium]|nr:hypothetical protein [Thermodesulfovibrionales bacterium]